MHGIPKIVLERLKGELVAEQQDRQSTTDIRQSASGDRQATFDNQQFPHIDANLLAAFVEKTLSERERAQVLNHLAQCAECRELAALSLPSEVAVAEPTRLRARRGWSTWSALRWGVLATSWGAVVIIVVVHSYSGKRLTIAPRPAGTESKQQVSLMAPAPPPVAKATKTSPAPSRGRGMSKRERPSSVGAALPAPPHAKPEFEPPAAAGGTSNAPAGAVSVGGPRTLTVDAERSRLLKDLTAAQAAGGLASSSAPQPQHVPLPSSERIGARSGAAVSSLRAKAEKERLSSMAFRGELESAAAQPGALWTISPDGKLQRSDDGGNTWKDISVDDKVTFRVIRAMGRDVWAGGSGGALYHSSDGGATWTRVNLTSGGSPTIESIVSIIVSPPDLQNITVRTAAGEQWTTEDGGRHWQKEER